jgi:hypothetical protein
MRAVCFITLLMLIPTTVDAQCGWVLWKKMIITTVVTTPRSSTTAPADWDPMDGFDQLAACRGSAKGAFEGLTKGFRADSKADVVAYPGGTSGFVTLPPEKDRQAMWALDFVCFPGGFDPRR